MALPKIDSPTFEAVVPSTGKKVRMRMMRVREEKVLLMAKEGGEEGDVLASVKQVVNNCLVDQLTLDQLAIFDVEFLFLKLRSASIGNVVEPMYRDSEDEEVRRFKVDLNEVRVLFPSDDPKALKDMRTIREGDLAVTLRYPPASLYTDKAFVNMTDTQAVDKMIMSCVERVWKGEESYDPSTSSQEELTEFLESLSVDMYKRIREFLANLPRLDYTIEYKNNKGSDRKITMRSLSDFFTLR
jgi:hypothetical protein